MDQDSPFDYWCDTLIDARYSPNKHINLEGDLEAPLKSAFSDLQPYDCGIQSNQFLDQSSHNHPQSNHEPFPMDLEHDTSKEIHFQTVLDKNDANDLQSIFIQTHEMASTHDIQSAPKLKNQKKQSKGDQMRNLYPNMMKIIFNSILNDKVEVFRKKLLKIRRKVFTAGELHVEIEEFVAYCRSLKQKESSLKNIFNFMNFESSSGKERTFKMMFQQFVVWFLERRYSVHILTSDQCEYKEKYLKGKNLLRYLPSVRPKKGHYNTSL